MDDFKAVNDHHGHQLGDAVLRAVARAIRNRVRAVDHVARYGGEELAIVLPHLDGAGAADLAERIRSEIASLRIPIGADETLGVTVSCGMAEMVRPSITPQALIAAADEALSHAKHAGENRVELRRQLAGSRR